MTRRYSLTSVTGTLLAFSLVPGPLSAAVYLLDLPGETPVYASHPAGPAYRLVLQDEAAPASIAHSRMAAGARSSSPQIDALIERIARRQQVDPSLVRAVVEVESSFRPAAVSPKGAVGVMQLMPATARRYGVADRRDPAQNLEGGVAYLKDLLSRFGGNVALALAAYNAGEHAVERHGRVIPTYRETMLYVPRVLEAYARHQAAERRASDEHGH